jgi:HK97 family phage portal protein
MANLLSRISAPLLRSLSPPLVRGEGEVRPGPYYLPVTGGWLPAGSPWNWWQSGTRIRSSDTSAMVEACVSAYAQTVAMCPGNHWLSDDDGGRTRVTNSDLSRILRQPNDYQSISDVLLNLTRRLYLYGEAFAVAIRNNRGEVSELHLMQHGVANVAWDGSVFYSLQGNQIVQQRYDLSYPIPARDVLHVKLHTPYHPLKGVSPILATELARAMSGAVLNQQVAFYMNEARPSFMLESPNKFNEDQIKELRKRWNDQTQGLNAGGSVILTDGLKANPVVASARDGQLADMLKMTDQAIALAFRMPLQVLGIGGTPFASTEALMQSWISQGLGFCLNHIEQAFDLMFRLRGVPDEYTEFDARALLRSAFKERVEGMAAGVLGGIFSSDEARADFDLAKTPGGYGEQPRVQQQVVPLSYGAAMQPPDPNAGKAPPAEVKPTANDSSGDQQQQDEQKNFARFLLRQDMDRYHAA